MLAFGSVLLACRPAHDDRLQVVATTANIAAIVGAVGGDRVSLRTIAPAGLCPGHFDIKPSDVAAVSRAELVIDQGWETWFPELLAAVKAPDLHHVTASTSGNWMLPDIHRRAVDELTDLLVSIDSVHADSYRIRAALYRALVDSAAGTARARVADVLRHRRKKGTVNVLAALHQAPLVGWLGCNVVGTYGRPEEFTAHELSRLARVGVDSNVVLVVDNLQSGRDAGLPLAEALGVRHVNLTNFPLDNDYPATLVGNAQAVADLLE